MNLKKLTRCMSCNEPMNAEKGRFVPAWEIGYDEPDVDVLICGKCDKAIKEYNDECELAQYARDSWYEDGCP